MQIPPSQNLPPANPVPLAAAALPAERTQPAEPARRVTKNREGSETETRSCRRSRPTGAASRAFSF